MKITKLLNSVISNAGPVEGDTSASTAIRAATQNRIGLEVLTSAIESSHGNKVMKQLFGVDVSAELALAAATLELVSGIMKPLHSRENLGQEEAYWMVDVWGKSSALRSLLAEFATLIDSEQPSGVAAGSFKARIGVLVLGCDELLTLVGGHLLSGLPQGLPELAKNLKLARETAQLMVESHVSDN